MGGKKTRAEICFTAKPTDDALKWLIKEVEREPTTAHGLKWGEADLGLWELRGLEYYEDRPGLAQLSLAPDGSPPETPED